MSSELSKQQNQLALRACTRTGVAAGETMKLKSKKSPGWGVDRSGGLSGSKNPECKRCTIIVHASCPKSRLHYVCSKYVVLYGHEIGAACRTIACMAMVCERDACSTVVAAPQLQLMSAKAGSGVAELVTRYS